MSSDLQFIWVWSHYSMYFFARTINPVDAIYGIIKEMAGDANSVKYVLFFMF